MIHETDPRIQALAHQAALDIKALSHAHNERIKGIYNRFRDQADAIRAEASTEELHSPSAGSLPSPPNELKDCFHHGRTNASSTKADGFSR